MPSARGDAANMIDFVLPVATAASSFLRKMGQESLFGLIMPVGLLNSPVAADRPD